MLPTYSPQIRVVEYQAGARVHKYIHVNATVLDREHGRVKVRIGGTEKWVDNTFCFQTEREAHEYCHARNNWG